MVAVFDFEEAVLSRERVSEEEVEFAGIQATAGGC
jgi:hypothetical protein